MNFTLAFLVMFLTSSGLENTHEDERAERKAKHEGYELEVAYEKRHKIFQTLRDDVQAVSDYVEKPKD